MTKNLRTLKALRRPIDKWGDFIIHIVTSKLNVAANTEN